MMEVTVAGVGILGPGLPDWDSARPVLLGQSPYRPVPLGRIDASHLPRLERRRATPTVRLASAVAFQAFPGGGEDTENLVSVFASSDGDTDTFDRICRSLAEPEPWISPHGFHNSVHNAPSGYWSIASGCRGGSTSLSAYDDSFSAGLVEAVTTLATEPDGRCLFVAYDQKVPPTLAPVRGIGETFACALYLSRVPQEGAPRLTLAGPTGSSAPVDALPDPALENLRLANPAARGLTLLRLLAAEESGRVVLPWLESGLGVEVRRG
jgi:hypothetical protein